MALAILLGFLLAAEDPTSFDWVGALDKYGIPFALVAVIVVGGSRFLVPGFVYQRAVADVDRERESRERLEQTIREDVVPALVTSAQATQKVLELLPRLEALILSRERPGGSP